MKETIVRGLLTLAQKISNRGTKHPLNTDGCFRTFSGVKFDLINPTPEMFVETDFIAGMAYNSHYSGQTPRMFTLAEHGLLVERLVAERNETNYPLRLAGLLHDGQEAFYGDMIKPLKNLLPMYDILEKNAQRALFDKYNLPISFAKEIKWADILAQEIEEQAFYHHNNNGMIYFYSPDIAAGKFMEKLSWLKYRIKNQ